MLHPIAVSVALNPRCRVRGWRQHQLQLMHPPEDALCGRVLPGLGEQGDWCQFKRPADMTMPQILDPPKQAVLWHTSRSYQCSGSC